MPRCTKKKAPRCAVCKRGVQKGLIERRMRKFNISLALASRYCSDHFIVRGS